MRNYDYCDREDPEKLVAEIAELDRKASEAEAELDMVNSQCRDLRTALGEILACHTSPHQPTRLCPRCEKLARILSL